MLLIVVKRSFYGLKISFTLHFDLAFHNKIYVQQTYSACSTAANAKETWKHLGERSAKSTGDRIPIPPFIFLYL